MNCLHSPASCMIQPVVVRNTVSSERSRLSNLPLLTTSFHFPTLYLDQEDNPELAVSLWNFLSDSASLKMLCHCSIYTVPPQVLISRAVSDVNSCVLCHHFSICCMVDGRSPALFRILMYFADSIRRNYRISHKDGEFWFLKTSVLTWEWKWAELEK
jgi:hypothetical protein